MERARLGASLSRELTRFARHTILDRAARILEERADEAAALIVREAGKTITQARKEVRRAVTTISLSAETARAFDGEVIPFDAYEGGGNRRGWYTREPLGVILAITPYNDALNLVAHKLGPAIAGGNAVVLKPSQLTPLTARFLVDVLLEAGLPDEIITVVHGDRQVAQALVAVRDIRMVSFTGGFATGERSLAPRGSRSSPWNSAGTRPSWSSRMPTSRRPSRPAWSGAFWAAGQNCVGSQRILIERSVYAEFRDRFAARTSTLRAGDPSDPATDVGPMISEAAAVRAERMVDDAVSAGARVLAGHRREGSVYWPTAVENVALSCELWNEEAFAPVVALGTVRLRGGGRRRGQQCRLRAARRGLHDGHRPRTAGRRSTGCRRRDDQRLLRLPHRQHAVRRSKYGSMGARGRALRVRGDDPSPR